MKIGDRSGENLPPSARTPRRHEALEHLDRFCDQKKSGSIEFFVKDGLVLSVDYKTRLWVDAAELLNLLPGFKVATQYTVEQRSNSSVLRIQVVEHKQLRVIPTIHENNRPKRW